MAKTEDLFFEALKVKPSNDLIQKQQHHSDDVAKQV